ncbi:MAG: aminomethyl-transferring glycine dehydrogenase subunit GcvPA [Planctomycetaceae bacterium]|nr:aminomethyl-transferring glycine dehydrogenase subunit GcvPA [Planctomycetaceae bacterium]
MSYIFTTPEQQQEMLQEIGVNSIEELFASIPPELRFQGELDLQPAKCELELEQEIAGRAKQNQAGSGLTCFLGGGVYDHFIPSVVDEISSRGEYYTAYTPYQAEASQGSLQVFFEYQTLICQLTGMDVSNASLYEGGTAITEAALMAMRVTRRSKKVAVLKSVHPEYREVLKTYLKLQGAELVEIGTADGTADLEDVKAALDEETAALVIQNPNFYGNLEQVHELAEAAHEKEALLICSVDPLSLGVLKRPGDMGVDIVTAEGQPLGIPMQYGGPFLGILACRQEYMRKMPGRVIGTTNDRLGAPCFVLNLQAREQHIRRDKATSNICTNQGLLALRATIYMTSIGPQGLKEVGELCCQKAHYAAEKLTAVDGYELAFDRPFFKEFVLRCPVSAKDVIDRAAESGLGLGPKLSQFEEEIGSETENLLLVAVTEKRTREEIDSLAEVLANGISERMLAQHA